ncbi:H/ACA ribonucleoprotein complex subunit 2-like protein [Ornithodoros turicata]|uniref:Hipothetical protein n=1 Tax=Ornithodoros turicata TaxID=34597 RepID=A0A2R5LH67_9ACAR
MTTVKRERNDDGYEDESLASAPKKAKRDKSVDLSRVKNEADDGLDESCEQQEEMTYEEKLAFVNAISHPMASKKLCKKLYKLLKKSWKHKGYVVNGLKAVQAAIRKGQTGLVILAGDVAPIDIISFLPGVCEEKGIAYVYTPSRKDIGTAVGTRRNIIVVMVKEHADYKPLMDECLEQVRALDIMV